MKTVRLMIPLLMLTGSFFTSTSALLGKAEYTKKEKKPCVTCHVKATSKELNDVAKCYKNNGHSLKGCEAKMAAEKKG